VALFDILKLVRGTTATVVEATWVARIRRAGWGVILPASSDGRMLSALDPLVSLRREVIGDRVRVFAGADGYQVDESAQDFLARHRAQPQPGADDPVPELLLLVGPPADIPFRIQFDLGATRAVGRLAFDNLEDYGRYAERVASHESAMQLTPLVDLIATPSAGDPIRPWAERLVAAIDAGLPKPLVQVQTPPATLATKEGVIQMLHAARLPGITLLAGHGLELGRRSQDQTSTQGAVVCANWTRAGDGGGDVPAESFLAPADLDESIDFAGRIVVAAASFSAGTPRDDTFALNVLGRVAVLTSRPFVSGLAQRALERGASAWVGHADRIWSYAGHEGQSADHVAAAYEAFFKSLIIGAPVGMAARSFSLRAATVALRLEELSDELAARDGRGAREFAQLWMAKQDLSNVIVLGDPAVRLAGEFSARRYATIGWL
jgi:hypothetical protein